MKKLARCAVLLAFALAFISCSNDGSKSSGGAQNLQAALSAGGNVNLDDYTVSGAKTYTVSKTTTITGDAKGATFIIDDDADVTFDGTKGLGTLLVGNSATGAKSALPAREATTTTTPKTKVTLKGSVTVDCVFVYVDCVLDAVGSGTFTNVVVGKSVTKLILSGSASLENLVALGDEITITISGDGVKIEKADKKAKEAAQKNELSFEIGDIDDDVSKDLEEAFENASKGDGKIISTKEDLAEAVKGIIKAYYDFAQKVDERSSSRAVATEKDAVATQLKDVFNVIYGAYTDDVLRDSIIKLFIGAGADENINLNAEINLANVKPSVGVDALIDLSNHVDEKRGKGSDDSRKSYFGDNYDTVNDFLTVADEYATLSKLYALGKLNVNVNNKSNYASAEAKFNLAVDVDNINGMIPELFKAYNNNVHHTYVPTSANLPVTAVNPFVSFDVKADLSKEDYEGLVKVLKGVPHSEDFDYQHPYPNRDDYDDENAYFEAWDEYMAKHREEVKQYFLTASYKGSYSGKISAGVSTTVMSSAKIPGGIITLSLDASYSSPAKILALLTWADGLDDVDDYEAFLRKLEKDYDIIPTVTVTDYDGKQTLKLGLDDIIYVIDKVKNNIGEIIQ